MGREYVPEGRSGTTSGRHGAKALASTGSTRRAWPTQDASSSPSANASDYISDGRGNVRIMAVTDVAGATGYDSGKITLLLPHQRLARLEAARQLSTTGTRRGLLSGRGRSRAQRRLRLQEGAERPLGALPGRARRLEERELVFAHPQVDVDGVVRIGRGARVVGVTFADEKRQAVYFDPELSRARRVAVQALPGPAADQLRRCQRGREQAADLRRQRYRSRPLLSLRQGDASSSTRSCWRGPSSRTCRWRRSSRSPITAADGTEVPAYLTLPPGSERQEPAGDRAAAWRPERARRMGLRLARPILRQSRLCGAPAQFSRLGRLWRRLVPAERLPVLADRDRRRQRRRPLAGRPGHRRSGQAGDRRLVLWRLCGAAVGVRRAGPVQGGRRDRAGHRPRSMVKEDSADFTNYRHRARLYRQRAAYPRRLAGAECRPRSRRRCCCSTATSTSTSGSASRG